MFCIGDGIEENLFKAADDYISDRKLDGIKSSNVQQLASSLKHNGVSSQDDIKFLSQDAVRFFKDKDLDNEEIDFLESLNVKQGKPVNLDNGVRLLGRGYNILMDQAMPPFLFKYDSKNTHCGVIVPDPATFAKVIQTETIMDYFENEKDMLERRMQQLNVSLPVSHTPFLAKSRAGFSSPTSYSFLFEQRMFEVSMANFEDLNFTEDFKKDAKNLPAKYTITDKANRQSFVKFFNRWGHFVVTKVFGGGSAEIQINMNCQSKSGSDFNCIKSKL